jgi:hypothetical protein
MKKKPLYIIAAIVLAIILLLAGLFLLSRCSIEEKADEELVTVEDEITSEETEESEITEDTEPVEDEEETAEEENTEPLIQETQEFFSRIEGYWYYEEDIYNRYVFHFYQEDDTFYMEYMLYASSYGNDGLIEFSVISENQDHAEAIHYPVAWSESTGAEVAEDDAQVIIDTGTPGDNMMSITYIQSYSTSSENTVSAPDSVHYNSMEDIYAAH